MVVGDRVALVGDVSGEPGALARIVRIDERTSVLRRTADDDDTTPEGRLERVVVANADQLVIVSALADPPPRTGFIDRCLVAAYDADIEPLLCLTKADLAGPEAVLDYYAELDLPYVLVQPDSDLADLRDRLAGQISRPDRALRRGQVDAGQPPGSGRRCGRSAWSARSARAGTRRPARWRCGCRWLGRTRQDPGWIIDTPGIRSFGLAHVSAGQPAARLPRPGRGHRRLPAQLRPHRRRRGLRAWTPGSPRARPTRAGWRRTAACWPPGRARATHATRPISAEPDDL